MDKVDDKGTPSNLKALNVLYYQSLLILEKIAQTMLTKRQFFGGIKIDS